MSKQRFNTRIVFQTTKGVKKRLEKHARNENETVSDIMRRAVFGLFYEYDEAEREVRDE